MRHWILHPLVFYPLAALLAALVIAISLKPLAWPRPAAAVEGELTGGAVVLEGNALGAPAEDAAHNIFVDRNFWGQARALRLAVLANQAPPGPTDTGVRILFRPEAAGALGSGPVTAEITYAPLPINAASGIAASLQGDGPAQWVSAQLPAEPGTIRLILPAQPNASALGLRALAEGTDQAYGLEITRIRLSPQGVSSN